VSFCFASSSDKEKFSTANFSPAAWYLQSHMAAQHHMLIRSAQQLDTVCWRFAEGCWQPCSAPSWHQLVIRGLHQHTNTNNTCALARTSGRRQHSSVLTW
jgi:hypothetical protein